ncbi:hypothetical protein [Edaphobacter sp. DSM 109919]|uniref:Uncharacterized protein n=1 Tax=Edaphobacter paludis TaxID=3035702 RepID=A0AAU7CU72_9BACT
MMTTPYKTLDVLDTKIQLVRLTTRQIHENYTGQEDDAEQTDTLLGVLHQYEHALLREQLKLSTSFENIRWIKEAIRNAGCLLVDLGQDEPDLMRDWVHGAPPINLAYAVANLLSRIILELSGIVWVFEQNYPEMKEEFDAERRYHAKLIQDAEDA